MANETLRREAEAAGVRLWEIAERWKLADSNFSRKLRRELSADDLARARQIIRDILNEREE